ncbi:hypothetical protein LOTGIDRAFT_144771 [Lottia gigantea]|uniref:G-protein coupled receptors family 1 profile domain-containing protein n=1 Tax=Lottia gigantea TaxID=225164 RepID=V4AJQ7_LOTGI|nr:hypothetical protein LOTGIDRAFT_144771 [Lottia gigantea]ESO94945.1 hypothetical protein LOTGIDRAFT_144771 [Lottia gigantea]
MPNLTESTDTPLGIITDVYSNLSANNGSIVDDEYVIEYELKHPSIGIILASFSFITIVGNIMVMIAVYKEIYLRTVTNYFIVSLAVADLMVGGIVMPFSISHEMTNQIWLYGTAWCDLWHSLDVLASSASILNLCVISLDRYWAITDPIAYPSKMSSCKVCLLITLVWLCSAGISFPAIAWWKAVTPSDLPEHKCLFTEDTAYLIFSSLVSFYFPTIIMMFVYCKIYRAAAAQTKGLKSGCKVTSNGLRGDGEVMTLRMHRGGMRRLHDEYNFPSASESDESPAHPLQNHENKENGQSHHANRQHGKFLTKRLRNFAISKKLSKIAREQKAAKTLGIVVGVFIMCWLPFFISNVLFGICNSCISSPDLIFSIFTWLGYINSGVNPIIYALSMRDFRRAFGKMLFVCCPKFRVKNRRRHTNQGSMSSSSFSVNCGDRCVALKI